MSELADILEAIQYSEQFKTVPAGLEDWVRRKERIGVESLLTDEGSKG